MAILKIYNPIVTEEQKSDLAFFYGTDGVCFKDVDEFIGTIPEDDPAIELRLHCDGGDVSEGWAIVDKLRSTGKKITAVIEGNCASMATVVLLAASERRAYPHASLLIHEPYYPAYTLAEAYRAAELEALATSLREDTRKMLDFYVERTGADRAELEALMSEDKFIDMERARTLGFIHEILPPASARAKGHPGIAAWGVRQINTNNQNSMSKNTNGEDKRGLRKALSSLAAALGLEPIKAVGYELSTESGDTITIDKPEGEDPAVGDPASPDGEHTMPDGRVIVIEEGVITEIREAGADPEPDPDELARANARIAELEEVLAEAQKNAKTSADKHILNLVSIAGGVAWLEKVRSEYKPAGRQSQAGRQDKGGDEKPLSVVQQRLVAYQERNKK